MEVVTKDEGRDCGSRSYGWHLDGSAGGVTIYPALKVS